MFHTVRSKVSLVYIGLVVLIALLGLVSISALSDISKTINGLITTNYNSIIRLSEMQKAISRQNVTLLEYLTGDDPGRTAMNFSVDRDVFWRYYNEEKDTIILPREHGYIAEIEETYRGYLQQYEQLLLYNLTDAVSRERASAFYHRDMRGQQALVEEKLRQLHDSNEVALFARRDEAASSAQGALNITMGLFLVAALGGYILATTYTRRFFSPLADITDHIKLIREGNLNRRTNIQTNDEFGILADAINNMVSRLETFEKSTLGSLMDERNRADSLVRSISEPMLLVDSAGELVMINQAFERLFHQKEQDILHRPIGEVLEHNRLVEYVNDCLKGVGGGGATIALETGGEERYYQIASTPVTGGGGALTGLIIILHNITEMKQLEKARGDYIATISHEFKTPLTSIVMGADMLSKGMVGPLADGQKEIADTICEDGQRLELLVEEILELSRMESSKMLYKFALCEVASIIDISVRQFQETARRNGVVLAVRAPSGPVRICADFSKITWVLNNLLSNALKYTKEGDQITVETRELARRVEISVTDTGLGVPPEFADQIFEKFVQVKGYDIEVRGSGLGLAVSREIVTAHKGEIWCDATVSSGSRFVMMLDKAEEDTQ